MRLREAKNDRRAVAIGGEASLSRTGFVPASRSIMPGKNSAKLCQIGVDFYEFLKETGRTSITDRLELREIYNTEFRRRSVVTLCDD